jgi:multidrug efflux pump subunit AcrA (membrane-fusion protein)
MKVLKDDLSDTIIKSPIKGIIAAIYIKEGQDVDNMIALKVINENIMKATINVTGDVVRNLKLDQKAVVRSSTDKSDSMIGSIGSIDRVIQENMSLYPVEIIIPNVDGKLLSGMYTEVELNINT